MGRCKKAWRGKGEGKGGKGTYVIKLGGGGRSGKDERRKFLSTGEQFECLYMQGRKFGWGRGGEGAGEHPWPEISLISGV